MSSYPNISPNSKRPEDKLFRYLTDDGTSSGEFDAIGDYTVATGTPTRFYFQAARDATIARMIVAIEDSNGMIADEYGNLNTALTNGITLDIRDEDGNVKLDFMDGHPVTTNGDWGIHCYDVTLQDWGSGSDYVFVRWTFSNAGAFVHLPSGWNIGCSLTDNFTGLLHHTFMMQGYY